MNLFLQLAKVVDYKLAGAAATAAGVLQIPSMAQYAKLFTRQGDTFLLEEVINDIKIFVLGWLQVGDDQTEAVGQGDGFIDAVVSEELVLFIVAVTPGFADEMAAVGGSIDEDIFRAGFNTAFNGGF